MFRLISRLLFVFLVGAGLARADVVPMAKPQLVHALQEGQPCCVIDGRSEASRKKQPLSDAIPYRPGLKIEPTAAVVVVADSDRIARRIAGELDAAYPGKRIIPVQGGIGVWESALMTASRETAGTPSFSFVIPKNTCESGSAIQKLRGGVGRH